MLLRIPVAGRSLPGVNFWAPSVQVALDHDAEDAARAGRRSGRDVGGDLQAVSRAACCCCVAASRPSAAAAGRPPPRSLQARDAGGVVVGGLAAAQDDVAVLVAVVWTIATWPVLVDRQEVWPRAAAWIASVAIRMLPSGAVLESRSVPTGPTPARDAPGLSVGPRPDGAPGRSGSPSVLGRDHVQELAAAAGRAG